MTVPKITRVLKVSAPKGNVIVKEGDTIDLLCKPNVYIAFCDFTNERTTFNYKLDYWRNVHQGEYEGISEICNYLQTSHILRCAINSHMVEYLSH